MVKQSDECASTSCVLSTVVTCLPPTYKPSLCICVATPGANTVYLKHVAAKVCGHRLGRYVPLVSTAGASAMEEFAAAMERGLAEGWSEPLLVHIPCKQSSIIKKKKSYHPLLLEATVGTCR